MGISNTGEPFRGGGDNAFRVLSNCDATQANQSIQRRVLFFCLLMPYNVPLFKDIHSILGGLLL